MRSCLPSFSNLNELTELFLVEDLDMFKSKSKPTLTLMTLATKNITLSGENLNPQAPAERS